MANENKIAKGSTFSHGANSVTPLINFDDDDSVDEHDVTGLGDDKEIIRAGTERETITVETLGPPADHSIAVGDVADATITYPDGTTTIVMSNALCQAARASGGQGENATTEFTFRPSESDA